MGTKNKLILALPAYNEAANLPALIESAHRVFTDNELTYEIVVVNDGSTDATAQVLGELAAQYPIHVVEHPENRGLGAAIRTLLPAALDRTLDPDDAVVCMDADNTHDPAYVPQMVEKLWRDGYDIVIASRFCKGSEEVGVPFVRRLMSRGARLLFRLFLDLPEVRDYTCGYRAYRAQLLKQALAKYGDRLITREGFACTDELLVHLSTLTKRVGEIPFVLRYDRKQGRSKLPLFRTILETLRMLIQKD
ncbi:MAG: glycosyltransferase [Candidatus Sumerlaea chitinivorans]|uniref:Glycosyltransferase n=1 Tax=Sumerlaea chitinivorans TaxID=2250252 RepID=A0A2Z4Y1S8_SUMC1|nr:Glycosyltransferase [Candidatus Sumerlaea chitinivorans]MCX7964879.1 glycosyltransferase [Candidatus Sumerlaea chitinivorans]